MLYEIMDKNWNTHHPNVATLIRRKRLLSGSSLFVKKVIRVVTKVTKTIGMATCVAYKFILLKIPLSWWCSFSLNILTYFLANCNCFLLKKDGLVKSRLFLMKKSSKINLYCCGKINVCPMVIMSALVMPFNSIIRSTMLASPKNILLI